MIKIIIFGHQCLKTCPISTTTGTPKAMPIPTEDYSKSDPQNCSTKPSISSPALEHSEKLSPALEHSEKSLWNPQIVPTPFCATAVAFSQCVPNLLAVGTGQNFGVAGKGCQHVYSLSASQSPVLRTSFLCDQTVLDCAWSEEAPSVLGAALGDGSIALWDVRTASGSGLTEPLAVLKGHLRECFSLEWNIQITNLLLTSSWDSSVRLWDVPTGRELLCLPGVHHHAVYAASWCPSQPTVLATCGGDGFMRILDVREHPNKQLAVMNARSVGSKLCHQGETLSLDWNKFSPFIVATSGTDNAIRLWDIRNIRNQNSTQPIGGYLSCLLGHSLAVRKVRWSPFRETILASGSYDMSVGVWDCREKAMKIRYSHHSEFVIDLDWNLFADGVLASASWDASVGLWDVFSGTGPLRLKQRPKV